MQFVSVSHRRLEHVLHLLVVFPTYTGVHPLAVVIEGGNALIAQTAVLRFAGHLRLTDVAELILNDVLVGRAVKLTRLQFAVRLSMSEQHIVVYWIDGGSGDVEGKVQQVNGQVEGGKGEHHLGAIKVGHQEEKVDEAKEKVQRPADDLKEVNGPTPAIVTHIGERFLRTRFWVHLNGHQAKWDRSC